MVGEVNSCSSSTLNEYVGLCCFLLCYKNFSIFPIYLSMFDQLSFSHSHQKVGMWEIHIYLERISNYSPKIIVISTCQSDQNVSNAADQVKTFKTLRSYIFNPIPIILWGQIKKHKKISKIVSKYCLDIYISNGV